MSAQPYYFERDQKPAEVPIWREGLMGVDWLALRYSPVYYGWGVPRGDGSPVIVVPGFLATDCYLQEMYWWLMRVGYRPYMSRIGRNADCLDILVDKLLETVDKAYNQTGRKVNLVGHSLGGVLSRAAAYQKSEQIASVITMGSPFRGISSHPLVLDFGDRVRQRIKVVNDQTKPACFTGHCDCAAASALQNALPDGVGQTAIFTKSDGIVDWHYCINDDPATNFEVPGTHGGLAFNPFVYQLIAARLHENNNFNKKKV